MTEPGEAAAPPGHLTPRQAVFQAQHHSAGPSDASRKNRPSRHISTSSTSSVQAGSLQGGLWDAAQALAETKQQQQQWDAGATAQHSGEGSLRCSPDEGWSGGGQGAYQSLLVRYQAEVEVRRAAQQLLWELQEEYNVAAAELGEERRQREVVVQSLRGVHERYASLALAATSPGTAPCGRLRLSPRAGVPLPRGRRPAGASGEAGEPEGAPASAAQQPHLSMQLRPLRRQQEGGMGREGRQPGGQVGREAGGHPGGQPFPGISNPEEEQQEELGEEVDEEEKDDEEEKEDLGLGGVGNWTGYQEGNDQAGEAGEEALSWGQLREAYLALQGTNEALQGEVARAQLERDAVLDKLEDVELSLAAMQQAAMSARQPEPQPSPLHASTSQPQSPQQQQAQQWVQQQQWGRQQAQQQQPAQQQWGPRQAEDEEGEEEEGEEGLGRGYWEAFRRSPQRLPRQQPPQQHPPVQHGQRAQHGPATPGSASPASPATTLSNGEAAVTPLKSPSRAGSVSPDRAHLAVSSALELSPTATGPRQWRQGQQAQQAQQHASGAAAAWGGHLLRGSGAPPPARPAYLQQTESVLRRLGELVDDLGQAAVGGETPAGSNAVLAALRRHVGELQVRSAVVYEELAASQAAVEELQGRLAQERQGRKALEGLLGLEGLEEEHLKWSPARHTAR